MKSLRSILYKSFPVIRVSQRASNSTIHNMLMLKSKYSNIIQNMKKSEYLGQNERISIILYIQTKIDKIESEIEDCISKQNALKIKEHYSNLTEFGSFNVIKMWNLKKKVLPSKNNVIVAKKDSSGNLITNKNSLLRLYRDEYIKRLTPKQPYSNLKEVQSLKNDLFEKRMDISRLSQSCPWKVSNIVKICKSLKNGKSRDEN